MGIRDKLKIYEKGSDPLPRRDSPLSTIGAEPIPFRDGVLWRFVSRFPLEDITHELNIPCEALTLKFFLTYQKLSQNIRLENILFLDLETTSLSTGTGNYPFLIGIGHIQDNTFCVEQFFMEDYSSEPLILQHIQPRLEAAEAITTFNGKTFDIPLLKTRYRINRVPGFPLDKASIDLIHPCRRIFKSLYENCALKTLEENVLGFLRQGDIPGWLIPEVFFSYQKHGETSRIRDVVSHNALDILSMLKLLMILELIYGHIERGNFNQMHTRALINMAHHLYKINPTVFLDLVRFLGSDVFQERSLFKKFSNTLKRGGYIDEAMDFWRKDESLYSLEELAKHAEHRERDFIKALSICEQAMTLIEKENLSTDTRSPERDRDEHEKSRWLYRVNRLKKRMASHE